jgi:DNA-binding SARP family transcriptional activator/ABC-type branched-subunit amino acid transport system substrate-binding protein
LADPDCEALVEYLVLGPIEATADGRPLTVGAGKQRALLAVLVMHANTAVSVDRIIDALWGERPPASAAKVVQVLISQLRKSLANGDEPSVIVTVGGGYMLRVAAGMTDVDQFDRLVEAGRHSLADGNPREAEQRLSEALGLWRGRAYEDVSYEEFAREEIRRLDERRAAALEERCEAMLADGRHADAVADLEKLAAEHPLRERVLALWMLALYRSGRRAEALSVYDTARRRLADELGIEPGERLARLHAAMLQADGDDQPSDSLEAPGRRRSAALLVGAAALLVLAAAAALVLSTRSSGGRIESISGDSVGLIHPADGHIIADFPTGQTPTVVLARDDHAWAIDADSQTVSRVGSDEPRRDQAVPGTPAALAWAEGSVWVSYSRLLANGRTASAVLRLDPDTLQPLGHVDLPQSEPTDAIPFGPLAVVDDHLWFGEPAGRLTEIDPAAMRVVRTVKTPDVARALASAGHTLWVLRADGVVTARDARTGRELRHFAVHTPHPVDIATAGGLVWVGDGFTGDVWRIDPGPPVRMSSVSVGASAVHLAGAGAAVWATDSVGGTLSRISTASARRLTVKLGSTPVGVAVSAAGVWTTVAGGGGGIAVGSSTRSAGGLALGTCGRVVYGGNGAPDVIIADDLALDTPDGTFATLAMAQAAEYALRLHRYQAGRFRVGLQVCNDATTGEGGYWDPAKCAANARAYTTTPKVVAVLAPYNSGCTATELPILNRASGGPVPVISQANDYAGLTQKITGTEVGEPRSHYPSGVRNMVRAYPSDVAETAADARLAAQLGARRVLVSLNPKADNWETSVAFAFARAARTQGIMVTGPRVINRRLEHTVERLIRHGVDGVFLAGWMSPHQINVLRSARRIGGPRPPIITWNGWINQIPIYLSDVPESRGMYVSGGYYTTPDVQLPPAGRRFMAAFAHTAQADTNTAFAPYAAQAVDIALTAIAHSDGTRQSVLRALFNAHITNGILGDIGFRSDGDLASVPVAVYRVPPGPTATLRPYRVFSVSPG